MFNKFSKKRIIYLTKLFSYNSIISKFKTKKGSTYFKQTFENNTIMLIHNYDVLYSNKKILIAIF